MRRARSRPSSSARRDVLQCGARSSHLRAPRAEPIILASATPSRLANLCRAHCKHMCTDVRANKPCHAGGLGGNARTHTPPHIYYPASRVCTLIIFVLEFAGVRASMQNKRGRTVCAPLAWRLACLHVARLILICVSVRSVMAGGWASGGLLPGGGRAITSVMQTSE